MDKINGNLDNRKRKIESLFSTYPILKAIDLKNNELLREQVIFKTLYSDEYVGPGACSGILFVIKGSIKVQKINKEGEETNLYNIKEGELCHEALSCIANFESLNIAGRAIQDSEVGVIPIDIVRKYFIQDEEFLLYMYRDLYKKFSTVIENKEERMHEPLEIRLVKLLINKKSKIIYATHGELAFEVDSVREVVSRKLKSIEKRGYIKLERGKIVIINDLGELLK
ncbi:MULTISPECIES: Crp/Fnr family transcriptional regulator [Clostridium]|uniref:Crp/Fnr family transcriptional regulator n=1 Tax=Clostridium cibarium TaxID=2762247 RepID=A0ABR8PUV2_9CLOT|nr:MULTISPECIES: Crp/Fnr family transcriptional regulator [Clostridium]MBD7911951.1 Crp/Fnr family transcriptional regulator [Clostridium cibarium]